MSTYDAFELAGDQSERAALLALSQRLEHAAPGPALAPLPPALRARTLAAVAEAAGDPGTAGQAPAPAPQRARRALPGWLRPRILVPAASLAAAAVLAAVLITDGGPAGTLEARTALTGSGGKAAVEVRELGIGRTVDLKSDSLPILPKGEYYEVWFVGPGDSPSSPNRISAGTFHPNPEGQSNVKLKAAVNPKLFPVMQVTSEPGDGDPRATGPVVLDKRLPLQN